MSREVVISIPATLQMTIEDGKVAKIAGWANAADAGYFGQPFTVYDFSPDLTEDEAKAMAKRVFDEESWLCGDPDVEWEG